MNDAVKKPYYILLLSFIFIVDNTNAADAARGQELHDENCISCHAAIYGEKGNEIYTRQNRKIETLEGLQEQLQRCKNSLGTNWPEDQIKDVQLYLNSSFYHFEE